MNYDKERILQDVRTVIDQNQTESGIGGVATDANTLDLDAQGTRDSKARVLREISAMVLKSPKNHMRIVATA